MNLKKAALFLLLGSTALLAACNPPDYRTDRQLRRELFFKCLEKLPKGPDKAVYNDWDEVVAECGSQAFYMAQTCVKNCN